MTERRVYKLEGSDGRTCMDRWVAIDEDGDLMVFTKDPLLSADRDSTMFFLNPSQVRQLYDLLVSE